MEHEYTNEITCPYCNYERGDSWEFDADDGTTICGNCEKEFNVSRNIEVTYSTNKLLCKDKEHKYNLETLFVKKKSYISNGEWADLPETEWKYFRVEICEQCDDKEYVEISKEEYFRELKKFQNNLSKMFVNEK